MASHQCWELMGECGLGVHMDGSWGEAGRPLHKPCMQQEERGGEGQCAENPGSLQRGLPRSSSVLTPWPWPSTHYPCPPPPCLG